MFIVIELQTNNGEVGSFVFKYTDLNEAYAKYHDILHYAAVSTIEVHTAIILSETGRTIACEHFAHAGEVGAEVAEE